MTPEGRRTLALRGPGAGGFTPAQSLAASNPCLNCGTNVQLEFCPECGQRVIEPDPTLKEFLHELAEELLHWDGKLANTFRTLVTKPGALTLEYLAGRRIRFISPLRVYLACSVLFFFFSAVAPARMTTDRFGRPVERGVVQVSQSTEQELTALDSSARNATGFSKLWLTHFTHAMRSPEALQHSVQAAIPRAMFVLVPLFAAFIGVVYRDRRRKYPQHLAFALHVHAALFLTLTLMLVGRFISSSALSATIQLLLLAPFVGYLVRATRAVYEGSVGQTVWRLGLAAMLYFGVFLVTVAALFAVIVFAS